MRTIDMQAHQRSEPYTVLEYQSSEPRVFGVEIRPRSAIDLKSLLSAIEWVGRSEGFSKELTFLVMTLPAHTDSSEIASIAACARAHRLDEKICLAVPANATRVATTITLLRRHGIATLLEGVGKESRLSDLTEHAVNGIVLQPDLVQKASGDPQAAAILDALVTLASNLGLKSFANSCATPSELNFARSAGINYIAHGQCSQALDSVPRGVPSGLRWPPSGSSGRRPSV